jgi:hypothetical protein
MLNSPLPCVTPRIWFEYPNMSFKATSATHVNSSSRDSESMIVPRREFKLPMTADWNSTGATTSTVMIGSRMTGFVLANASRNAPIVHSRNASSDESTWW